MAHIIYWLLQETWPGTALAFVDDVSEKTEIVMNGNVYRLVKDWDFREARAALGGDPEAHFKEFCLALTDPRLKKIMVEKAIAHGLRPAPPIVHPRALIHGDEIEIGDGSYILGGAVVQACSKLGRYVSVCSNAVVGHHAILGDYVTQNVTSATLGFVELGEGVEIGTGSCVRGRVRIAPWAMTGMMACVVKDIDEPGSVHVGVPARPFKKDTTAAKEH
jgi:UDP-3-O-[3-hydroxymyristoyl] glucosamine N-acyltransferase